MKKEYWLVILAYVIMQLSSFIGIPLVTYIGTLFGQSLPQMEGLAVPVWLVISFAITLILVVYILRHEFNERNQSKISISMIWAIFGVFLAFLAQTIAANIESMFGVDTGSENTQQIIRIIESFPIVIFVSSIIGPILEEIIFRKIIFGTLYNRMNVILSALLVRLKIEPLLVKSVFRKIIFQTIYKRLSFFISALLSSIIFAIAHFELEHTLLYSAMGFTFAFLYVKTNRILVPIFAHVAMNSLVVIVQIVYKEEIEKIIQETEKIQTFIGGFL